MESEPASFPRRQVPCAFPAKMGAPLQIVVLNARLNGLKTARFCLSLGSQGKNKKKVTGTALHFVDDGSVLQTDSFEDVVPVGTKKH